jgi:hypothetical protein
MVWDVLPMTCKTCAEAAVNAAVHSFNDGCDVCATRHFAHLQVFYESREARSLTEAYYAALERRFGTDGVAAAHAEVKAWAVRIDAARAAEVQG